MTITGCIVPGIWSMTNRIFCHFGPFFCPFTLLATQKIKIFKNEKNAWRYYHFMHKIKNVNHMMYGSRNMKRDRQNFLSFWTISSPFTCLTTPKNQNFEKLKKNLGDIIILHKKKNQKRQQQHLEISSFYNSVPKIMIICYTVPEIWCVTDVIIFHFGPFLPFYPANSPKNQNFKKMKNTSGDNIILHKCTKNYDQMMYGS